ncbi:hypothetical protein [Halostreptopolyspora alba]|uniref:Uncharacterized protein n=1 Tax=Halostreptopolyspora alba TaxID=2487137 RepID=A0A3N0E8U9_9ACTN|nr:hypothetical protein EFW17_13590 [Nocardiopsaceae bacterium YIM 96095]
MHHHVVTDSSQTITLTGNPDGYDAFVQAADIRVESAETAIAAITFYLVMTRSQVFRKVVAEADDLNLDKAPVRDAEKEAVREAREDASDVITEPTAEQTDDGYRVTVYYQQSDTLRSWTGTVSPDGALDGENKTHTTGLPVMFIE